ISSKGDTRGERAAGAAVGSPAVASERGQPERPYQDSSLYRNGVVEYQRALMRRNELVVVLADIGDATVADRLAHLLSARESPTGLGIDNWNVWTGWVEDGYGRASWGGTPSDARRAAHIEESVADGSFSTCLQ